MGEEASLYNDAWLSGFIDGEGCFTRCGKYPRFKIGLREDDGMILAELRNTFGGALYDDDQRTPGINRKPQIKWEILTRQELGVLIGYLERFPLRAKKAEQFAAWRKEFSL